jgi:hypothetical protein
MPRYFFNLRNDVTVDDPEGVVLAGVEAARETALSQAREMAKVSIDETGRIDLQHRVEVMDEGGAHVLTVHFSDAVKIESAGRSIEG